MFRLFIGIAFVTISNISIGQTNFTTIEAGDYGICEHWENDVCAPIIIDYGDTVFINHDMLLIKSLEVRGVLIVDEEATLTSTKMLFVTTTGELITDGDLSIDDEIHIDGKWYNNGYSDGYLVHSDGYICNTGTIEIDEGQVFDLHGTTMECGGLIIACEVRIHENTSTGNNAILTDVNVCCLTGVPTVNYSSGILTNFNTDICSVMLSVEINSFQALELDGQVVLEWSTLSEVNNDYFMIMRSSDGVEYEIIGEVAGVGNSSALENYRFIDKAPLLGQSYYQLVQVDFDGQKCKSSAVSIVYRPEVLIKVFPNPTKENAYLELYISYDVVVSIEIYNLKGQLVSNQTEELSKGDNRIVLRTADLIKGEYLIKVNLSDKQIVKSLIKL